MRKLGAFLAKDARLLARHRVLWAVLVLYPLLAAGVVGAAFSRTGRPVPVGLVNLDRPTEEVLWMGAKAEDPGLVFEVFRENAESAVELGDEGDALKALEEGTVQVALGPPGGGGWWGGVLDPDRGNLFLKEMKKALSSPVDLEGPVEAGEVMGSQGTLVLGVRGSCLPFLGEGFWVEGRNLDAGSLAEAFAGGSCELRPFPGIRQAKEALTAGRVDAVVVLPPGLVHSLKALDDTAFLRIMVDQSNLLKAHFAETGVRGLLSRVSEEAVRQKLRAVVSGLKVLVSGGDFFGTEVTGLGELRGDLERVKEALAGRPDLARAVSRSLELADTVIRDLDVAADYLRGTALPLQLQLGTVSGRPLSAKDAAVPSLVVLSLLWTGMLCGATLVAWEREEGMLERVSLTGVPSRVPIAAKALLSGAVVGLLALVLLFLSSLILGMPVGRPGLVIAALALGSLSISALGLVVGAAVEEVPAAMVAGAMISFVLLFLCGSVYPLEQMPVFLRWTARLFPPTHVQEVLSGVLLQGRGWRDSWLALLATTLLGAAFSWMASRLWSRVGRS